MAAGDSNLDGLTRCEEFSAHSDDTRPRNCSAARQWEYRQRRKRDIIEAIGNEAEASRVTLLALLASNLAALEAHSTPQQRIAPARNSARRVLSEIIARYASNSEEAAARQRLRHHSVTGRLSARTWV